ncbi:hypothetical protein [Salinarimonas soli]|uniref:Uncharacterized protein n=1 Tax=Salinarimonas soli TaxID=1638099 RepID=A0A5B2VZU3_9HYPH|nr:hypothetical protein [Salinarimonas soli]KAA2243970.1 hypothetical protein F0L46_01600 [Salinarimonas soli]
MRIVLAALLSTLALGISPGARAMSYRAVPIDNGTCGAACPAAIMATGTIEVDEHQRFARFVGGVDRSRLSNVLVVSSPGGNVAGSLRLGFLVRRLGMRTLVGRIGPGAIGPGSCASACVYLFMAGAERRIVPGSRLAVHAARSVGVAQRDIVGGGMIDPQVRPGAFEDAMREYAGAMGVSPALIDLASSIPHESAHILSDAELSRYRLTTAPPARGGRPRRAVPAR